MDTRIHNLDIYIFNCIWNITKTWIWIWKSRIWIPTKFVTRIFVSKIARTFNGCSLSMSKLPSISVKVQVWTNYIFSGQNTSCFHFFNICIHLKKSLRYSLYQSIKLIFKSEKKWIYNYKLRNYLCHVIHDNNGVRSMQYTINKTQTYCRDLYMLLAKNIYLIYCYNKPTELMLVTKYIPCAVWKTVG